MRGQTVFAGIDVSAKSWRVKILGAAVDPKPFSQAPSPETLVRHLKKFYPGYEYVVGYEAGYCGFWIAHELERLGVHCVVIHPADIPTSDKERRFKNDTRDCIKIAHVLREDRVAPIHIPMESTLEDRELVRTRDAFVRRQTRAKNQIKSLLAMHGLAVDGFTASQNWSRAYIERLSTLVPERPSLHVALDEHLRDLAAARDSVARATLHIRRLARTDRYRHQVGLVTSIPGFGLVSAMIILTEIEDIRHFRTADHLNGLIGLVPSTNSSGDSERVGSVSPRGRRQLRSIIIEAAWVAIRCDPELTTAYQELCSRMVKQKAIIRIARKLISRLYHVLRSNELYRINNAQHTAQNSSEIEPS